MKKDCCAVSPIPVDGRALYTLLLRAVLSWNCKGFAGVFITGAMLLRPPVPGMKLWELVRWTVENPIPWRLSPDEERCRECCAGRPGASDIREPEFDRKWLPFCAVWLCDRFIADVGIGMEVMLCEMLPKVWIVMRCQSLS